MDESGTRPVRPVHPARSSYPRGFHDVPLPQQGPADRLSGADPEIRTIISGARVAQFSLGTTRRWNDRDGKPREKTQWHRVLVWDSLPATFGFVERYLRKGDRVYVEGEIDYRSYETDSGDTRWITEIKATDVLGAGETGGGAERRSGRSTRPAVVATEAELEPAL